MFFIRFILVLTPITISKSGEKDVPGAMAVSELILEIYLKSSTMTELHTILVQLCIIAQQHVLSTKIFQ